MSFWEKIGNSFPVNQNLIWLNNCGTTPMSRYVEEEIQNFCQIYAGYGLLQSEYGFAKLKKNIKVKLAALLQCQEEEIVLIHHTSEGMNFLSHGAKLSAGDEVILVDGEYPSNVYPWEHLETKGVGLKYLSRVETPDQFLENLKKEITPATKLMALSAVDWCSGMAYPLSQISDILKEKNIQLVLDGAQGVGLVDINLSKLKVSALCFSAWKWLLGPLGLGAMYVAKEQLEYFNLVFKGTSSVIEDEKYLPYKTQLKPNADRFEISTPSLIDYVWFSASLNFLAEIGFDRVQLRIFELSQLLNQELENLGYQTQYQLHQTQSGIVSFSHPNWKATDLYAFLKKNNVVCTVRDNRIRLAPHVYISENQIKKVIADLKNFNGN